MGEQQAEQPPQEPDSQEVPKDARTMGMLCHLLALFLWFVGPLIIWLIKKDEHEFVDDQGKEALNFQLTLLIGHVVAAVLWTVCIGFFLTLGLEIVSIIFCIIGAMKANSGVRYRYPFAIRMIK